MVVVQVLSGGDRQSTRQRLRGTTVTAQDSSIGDTGVVGGVHSLHSASSTFPSHDCRRSAVTMMKVNKFLCLYGLDKLGIF